MNWIEIVWSLIGGACLTLTAMHALVWLKDRQTRANLAFALLCICVVACAMFELGMMRAQSAEQFGTLQRWFLAPVFVGIVAIVSFVRIYFRTGRLWLAHATWIARLAGLIVNFTVHPNIFYGEIEGLRHVEFLGSPVVVADAVPSPWLKLDQLGALLLVVYVADASLTLWKRGGSVERRHALVVGGSLTFFVLIASAIVALIHEQVVSVPYLVSLPFMIMVCAMGYELSCDVLRAAQLARDLRESEQRMELAADAAQLGLWSWDVRKDTIWATDKARELFGFTKSEPLDFERFIKTLHPEDREPVSRAVAKSMNGDGDFESEYRIVRPNGPTLWIAGRGRVDFGDNGKPLRMRGVSIDITDRKHAEEKFRLAVEAAPSAIVMVNQQGQIVLINALTEKFFRYSRDELVGQPVETLVPERFRGAHSGHRAGFFAAPESRAMGSGRELFARRSDGSEFPVEIGLNPIRTEEGVLVLCAIVDITERQQTMVELHRHRQELAHVSRVSIMGELSASMAHELNQPLTAILTNAQAGQRFIASNTPDLDEFREILKDIAFDTTRARDVIRHLRALVKKSEPHFASLDLGETIREVVGFLHGDIVGRNVRVLMQLAPDLPPIHADRIQVQQVMINLLLNAFDAMNGSPMPERRVTVLTELEPPKLIRVTVRDRGMGIRPDRMENVFEPFFTTKPEGMGMGLSVTRSIIESHGGKIWVENNADCGAAFHFTLPVAAAQ